MSELSTSQLLTIALTNRMINGDDRFRITPISDAETEKYDGELGQIAQKSKQERFFIPSGGSFNDSIKVTYLKTALIYDDKLIRVDAIAKLILGRYNRERVRIISAPYSLVLETVMASTRAAESPVLWVLVSWLCSVSSVANDWFSGSITTQQLLDSAVIEQMEVLKRSKGKIWLKKKKVDPDYVIETMSQKYGLAEGGHRMASDYMRMTESGKQILAFEKLPIISALFSAFNSMSAEQRTIFKGINLIESVAQ